MNEKLEIALLSLGGTMIALLIRDVIVKAHFARVKRRQEIEDRDYEEGRSRAELFGLYARPLHAAVQSLKYRLEEIVNKAPAVYLLADRPKQDYVEYKRISTCYRLAAVLGWIRAFRKERSYLAPDGREGAGEIEDLIGAFEKALADGQHVEDLRLNKLLSLWSVSLDGANGVEKRGTAVAIDNLLHYHLDKSRTTTVATIEKEKQFTMCAELAKLIGSRLHVEIPTGLVTSRLEEAIVFLGMREAYIYRDWQSAIGDLMIRRVRDASRRFDVIGYGSFEHTWAVASRRSPRNRRRMSFERIEALFDELDMSQTMMSDARQAQIKAIFGTVVALDGALKNRLEAGGDRKKS